MPRKKQRRKPPSKPIITKDESGNVLFGHKGDVIAKAPFVAQEDLHTLTPVDPDLFDLPASVLTESVKADSPTPSGRGQDAAGEAREKAPSKDGLKLQSGSRGGQNNLSGGDTTPTGDHDSQVSLVEKPQSEGDALPAPPTTTQLAIGLHEKVDYAIYSAQNAISRSDLVGYTNTPWTPAKFKYFKDHPAAQKTTPDMEFGQAFHTLLLEPELFQSRYVVSPFQDFRSGKAKTWRDEVRTNGLTVITREQQIMLDTMVQSAREHPHFSTVFKRSGAHKEVTAIVRHPATGLLLKARYDMVPHGNVIPDIKSTVDASPDGFGKQVWNLEYGFQAAHYLDVWNLLFPEQKKREFIFFAFEKEPPFLCEFYLTPYSLIEYCRKIIRARLYTIASCMKTNRWPGYKDEYKALGRDDEFELPRFAVIEMEKSEEMG